MAKQTKVEGVSRPSVLIVSQYFFPENFVINTVASRLGDNDHNVTVLTGIPSYPTRKASLAQHNGLRIVRERFGRVDVIRVPILSRGTGSRFRLALNYLSFLLSASVFGLFLIRSRPDVIFVNQLSPATSAFPAILLKILHRSKLLLWVQDLWPDSLSAVNAVNSRGILWFLKLYMRVLYRSADIIAVQSHALAENVALLCPEVAKIRYLPNTADRNFQRVSLAEDANERQLFGPGFNIVIAGNIGIAQNLETIIRAIEILRNEENIQWTFIGDGSRRAWLERQIYELKLERTVRFLGPYPPEKMPTFFAIADALLVSLRDKEVFARTIPARLQAYLACGRPILGSVQGESARIICESGAGLVSRPDDPQSLANIAKAMSQLSHVELATMGESALRYSKVEFDPDHWNSVLEDWLRELSFSSSSLG